MDLFITHTPSHILFALNMMKAWRTLTTSTLLVVGDFPDAEAISQRIAQGPFEGILIKVVPGYFLSSSLQTKNGLMKRIGQLAASMRTIRLMRSAIFSEHYQRVFVFNDTRHEVQVIMGELASKGTKHFAYIDEGFAPYREDPIGPRMRGLRFIFGSNWHPLRNYGTHPLIDTAYLCFPQYAHKALKAKKLLSMPEFCLQAHEVDHLLMAFGRGQELPGWMSQHANLCFVFLPLSQMITAPHRLIRWLENVEVQCQEKSLSLVVKPHPRETMAEQYGMRESSQSMWVDQTIPGELLLAKLKEQVDVIYAEASSILLLARWLDPSSALIAVQLSSDIVGDEFQTMFLDLGITFQDLSDFGSPPLASNDALSYGAR